MMTQDERITSIDQSNIKLQCKNQPYEIIMMYIS